MYATKWVRFKNVFQNWNHSFYYKILVATTATISGIPVLKTQTNHQQHIYMHLNTRVDPCSTEQLQARRRCVRCTDTCELSKSESDKNLKRWIQHERYCASRHTRHSYFEISRLATSTWFSSISEVHVHRKISANER